MNTNTIPQMFDNLLDAIQSMLMSFLTKLGPFFVALMPALFTAYAIFHTFATEAGEVLAMLFAVIVGLAMETVGIVATHTAIDLYNAKEREIIQPVKFRLMVWLVPIYVVGVAAVVGFSDDAFTPLVKGLGIASPFLTSIVYVAVALARDIKRTETKQSTAEDRQSEIEADERAWQRKKELMELELKHKEKLARIEAKNVQANVQPAVQSTVQPAVQLDAQTVQNEPNSTKLDAPNAVRLQTKQARLDGALDFLKHNPRASYADIGRHIGLGKSSGENYANELQQAGRLGKNGQGWEVAQ